jgi:hypothetical protein
MKLECVGTPISDPIASSCRPAGPAPTSVSIAASHLNFQLHPMAAALRHCCQRATAALSHGRSSPWMAPPRHQTAPPPARACASLWPENHDPRAALSCPVGCSTVRWMSRGTRKTSEAVGELRGDARLGGLGQPGPLPGRAASVTADGQDTPASGSRG